MRSREYFRLVEALRLCALPYNEQAGALPDFVFLPDEVVLEFDDAYRALSKSLRVKLFAMGAGQSIRRLDELHQEMTDAPDKEWVWSTEAMREDARWERSRQLSTAALSALHEPLRRPVFPHSVWIGKSPEGEVVQIRGDEIPEPD